MLGFVHLWVHMSYMVYVSYMMYVLYMLYMVYGFVRGFRITGMYCTVHIV